MKSSPLFKILSFIGVILAIVIIVELIYLFNKNRLSTTFTIKTTSTVENISLDVTNSSKLNAYVKQFGIDRPNKVAIWGTSQFVTVNELTILLTDEVQLHDRVLTPEEKILQSFGQEYSNGKMQLKLYFDKDVISSPRFQKNFNEILLKRLYLLTHPTFNEDSVLQNEYKTLLESFRTEQTTLITIKTLQSVLNATLTFIFDILIPPVNAQVCNGFYECCATNTTCSCSNRAYDSYCVGAAPGDLCGPNDEYSCNCRINYVNCGERPCDYKTSQNQCNDRGAGRCATSGTVVNPNSYACTWVPPTATPRPRATNTPVPNATATPRPPTATPQPTSRPAASPTPECIANSFSCDPSCRTCNAQGNWYLNYSEARCGSYNQCLCKSEPNNPNCLAPTQAPPPVCAPTANNACGCTANCRDGANTDYACCHRACVSNSCVTVPGGGSPECNGEGSACVGATPTPGAPGNCVVGETFCDYPECNDGQGGNSAQCARCNGGNCFDRYCASCSPNPSGPPPQPPPLLQCGRFTATNADGDIVGGISQRDVNNSGAQPPTIEIDLGESVDFVFSLYSRDQFWGKLSGGGINCYETDRYDSVMFCNDGQQNVAYNPYDRNPPNPTIVPKNVPNCPGTDADPSTPAFDWNLRCQCSADGRGPDSCHRFNDNRARKTFNTPGEFVIQARANAGGGATNNDSNPCLIKVRVKAPDPRGAFLGASCDSMTGWACDLDSPSQPLSISFYKDGPVGVGTFVGSTTAGAVPTDPTLQATIAAQCGNTTNHYFNTSVANMPGLKDANGHQIYAYAINYGQGQNTLLTPQLNLTGCAGPWIKVKDGSFMKTGTSTNIVPLRAVQYDNPAVTAPAYFIEGTAPGHTEVGAALGISLGDFGSAYSDPHNWFDTNKDYAKSPGYSRAEFIDYVKSRKAYKELNDSDLSKVTTKGVYVWTGATPMTITTNPTVDMVLIVGGDVTINTPSNSFNGTGRSFALMANTINFDQTEVEATGIFIANTVATGARTNQGLKIVGNIVASTALNFQRQWDENNNTRPSLYIVNDINQYTNLLPYLSTSIYEWNEIQ